MNEQEAIPWLTDDERYIAEHIDNDAVWQLIVTLAKTRKALTEHEWRGCERYESGWCLLCNRDAGEGQHAPGCIFATMPRPKETTR